MNFPSPRPLLTDYQGLYPGFNRLHAKEVTRWAKDLTLVHGMFYASIFQDALHFVISGEDVMVNLAEAIENYRWGEFKAWLDVHHDLLIQHREVEAPDSSVESAPSLVQRGPHLEGEMSAMRPP